MVDVTRTTVVGDYQPAIEEEENNYDSTITNLLGNDAVNRWLKKPREGQYGIVFFINTFSGEK